MSKSDAGASTFEYVSPTDDTPMMDDSDAGDVKNPLQPIVVSQPTTPVPRAQVPGAPLRGHSFNRVDQNQQQHNPTKRKLNFDVKDTKSASGKPWPTKNMGNPKTTAAFQPRAKFADPVQQQNDQDSDVPVHEQRPRVKFAYPVQQQNDQVSDPPVYERPRVNLTAIVQEQGNQIKNLTNAMNAMAYKSGQQMADLIAALKSSSNNAAVPVQQPIAPQPAVLPVLNRGVLTESVATSMDTKYTQTPVTSLNTQPMVAPQNTQQTVAPQNTQPMTALQNAPQNPSMPFQMAQMPMPATIINMTIVPEPNTAAMFIPLQNGGFMYTPYHIASPEAQKCMLAVKRD